MSGIISVNVTKYKAAAQVNRLVGENYRDDEDAKNYEDGHRNIDTDRTKENVFLLERPENYDRMRKDKIEWVNGERAKRASKVTLSGERERQRQAGTLQASASKEAAQSRKLRADTVDTLGLVVQPSAEYINGMTRGEQTRFFRDALRVMQDNPEWFGHVDTAAIHYDETTPHMQCLASTINTETLTSDAKRIVGNKSKMSDRQTLLAEGMKKLGWDVERGIKRVDNPEYVNFKTEMEMMGFVVNERNDRLLMAVREELRQANEQLRQDRLSVGLDKANADAERMVRSGELDRRELEVEIRERGLGGQKASLDSRMSRVEKRERAISAREKSAGDRGKGLDKREKDLDKREKDLDRREANMSAGHKQWTRQANAWLNAQKSKNKEEAGRLEEWEKELDARDGRLGQREEKLDEERAAFESGKERWAKSATNREKGIRRRESDALQNLKSSAQYLTDENNRRLQEAGDMDGFAKILESLSQDDGGMQL